MKHLIHLVKEVGILTFSFTFAFLVFMGIVVAKGFTPPVTAAPGVNVPPPVNVGSLPQGRLGTFSAADVWSDALGDWMSALGTPKRYHLEAEPGAICELFEGAYESRACTRVAQSVGQVTSVDSDAYYFCTDKNGCEITLAVDRKGGDGIRAKGPGVLFISPGDDDKWRITKTIDPDDSTIVSNEGKDGASGPQTILSVGSGRCELTDGDAPGVDSTLGFGLKLDVPGTFRCILDIKD